MPSHSMGPFVFKLSHTTRTGKTFRKMLRDFRPQQIQDFLDAIKYTLRKSKHYKKNAGIQLRTVNKADLLIRAKTSQRAKNLKEELMRISRTEEMVLDEDAVFNFSVTSAPPEEVEPTKKRRAFRSRPAKNFLATMNK